MLCKDQRQRSRGFRGCYTCCSSHQEKEGEKVLDPVILQLHSSFVRETANIKSQADLNPCGATFTQSAVSLRPTFRQLARVLS